MKVYDVVITDDMMIKGVKAISLVADPATENDWITLSTEEEIQLAEVDKEKRILMGVVLEPMKLIPRKGNPENFYIRFSKGTIELAQENFFKSGFQNQSTIEHNGEAVDGNTVIESWIVEDTEKDKTSLYNLSAPVGSWVIKMKINNPSVWDEYVKTGKVKGFSIEGFFKPIEMSELAEEKLTAEDKLEQVIRLLFD